MVESYTGFDKALKYLFDNATEVAFERTLNSGEPIGTITIDGQTLIIYAPTGGGSSVSYTPVVQFGEELGRLSIDGTNHSIYAPTVEANPAEASTDELSKIKIGNTVYDVVGGSGAGGQYTCDLLFNNTSPPTPTSGTANVTRTYELSRDATEYDMLIFLPIEINLMI